MAPVTVTITYRKPGTLPPIFLSGTFSDWQPQEMSYVINEDGDHVFQKDITAEENTEIQYKFRIGFGDWWALDDVADTATDNQGNVNNVRKILADSDSDAAETNDGEDSPEDSCPLFSHECPGSNEGHDSQESIPNAKASNKNEPLQSEELVDDIDYNDPRIEQFPSKDRESILTAIRRIETNTDEDRAIVEGIPPSPVVLPNTSSSDLHLLEPPSDRLNASRSSLGSFSSSRSNQSLTSLEPIEEAPYDGNCATGLEHTSGSAIDHEHDDDTESASEAESADSGDDNTTHTVVQQAGPMRPSVTLEVPSDEDEGIAMSIADTTNKGNGTLRKRNMHDAGDRPASSTSVRSIQETSKNEHWLRSFLRVVFVDWIGGIVSRLWGSRRKALLTVGATVLIVAASRKSY